MQGSGGSSLHRHFQNHQSGRQGRLMLYTLIQNISIRKKIRSKNKMGEPRMTLSIGKHKRRLRLLLTVPVSLFHFWGVLTEGQMI